MTCGDRVTIIRADIRELKEQFSAASFDAVISNPPFYPIKSGLLNEDSGKAVSRHELHGTLADFLSISAYLLKRSGAFLTIYPCSRIGDLIEEMRTAKLEPKTLRFIHPNIEEPANLVMVEGIKGAGRRRGYCPRWHSLTLKEVTADRRGKYSEGSEPSRVPREREYNCFDFLSS